MHTPLFNSAESLFVNEYLPGQSFGDPLMNESTPVQSQVTVTGRKPARLFFLPKSAYIHIYIDTLNELAVKRHDLIKTNFQPFCLWEDSRLKNLLIGAKERILRINECLVREEQAQPYIYLLISGKLRYEKKVSVESVNYWPEDMNTNWIEKKVTSNVLFKIADILPMKMFGERESIYEQASPVQIVSAMDNTRLVMISRKDMMKSKSFTLVS